MENTALCALSIDVSVGEWKSGAHVVSRESDFSHLFWSPATGSQRLRHAHRKRMYI